MNGMPTRRPTSSTVVGETVHMMEPMNVANARTEMKHARNGRREER